MEQKPKPENPEKTARLAEALRANLRRRKAQSRAMESEGEAGAESESGEKPQGESA